MLTFDAGARSTHQEGMRKPRFKRVPPKSALTMAPTMYEVLELIYQFKALRSHHIAMHLPHRHARGLSHSLRLLFDHGLIEKRLCGLYEHDTYYLLPRGYETLSGRDLPPRYLFLGGGLDINLSREWDHSMMTIDLLSNLKAGADAAGIRLISAEEIYANGEGDSPFIFPRKSVYTERKTKEIMPYTVVPDGVVGLEYQDSKRAFFALEAEHNKANSRFDDDDLRSKQNSTRKKIKAYRDVDWRQVYARLGIGNMRVLIVAPTPKQIENKFQVARSVVAQSHLFLGHWMPVVQDSDVPILPDILDAPWLRIGLPPEQINASSLRKRA
ncbi:hypothetical protein [Dinoroseobacter sp. S76]|uniref:hypothetical protein n=1 Tax=Dinoroseobacter sp. S76 TaxID=3415124 RepID=UPI003C7EBBC0